MLAFEVDIYIFLSILIDEEHKVCNTLFRFRRTRNIDIIGFSVYIYGKTGVNIFDKKICYRYYGENGILNFFLHVVF